MTKKRKELVKLSTMKRILLAHDISEIRRKIGVLNFTAIIALILSIYSGLGLRHLPAFFVMGIIVLACVFLMRYYRAEVQDLVEEMET